MPGTAHDDEEAGTADGRRRRGAGRRRGARERSWPRDRGRTPGGAAAHRPAGAAAGQDRGQVPGGRAGAGGRRRLVRRDPAGRRPRRARRRGRGGPRGGRLGGDGAAARRAGRVARRRGRPRARAAADRRVRRPDAVAARRHPRPGGARPGRRDAVLHHLRASPAAGARRGRDGQVPGGTGTGPLGTGSPPVLATSALAPGELVLLYSDGLVERPNRTIAEGMAELAVVAADAAASRSPAPLSRQARCRPGRGRTGLPADRGAADPHRPRRRHHRASRPVAGRPGPGPAPVAAERTDQPDHRAGRLRRAG